MHRRAFRIFLLGLLFTGRCLAIYVGMDRVSLVREIGPPVSRAIMGTHEILLYPNGVRIELENGKVVDVQGRSFDPKPPAIYLGMDRVALVQELGSPISSAAKDTHEILLYPNGVRIELEDSKVLHVQGLSYGVEPPTTVPAGNAPATVAETPKIEKPALSGTDKPAQSEAEAEKQAYSAQTAERAKMENAIMQMEKAHDTPHETPPPSIEPMRLLMELFLRWVVILLALKLTCLFWGVTVEWPGLMLVAVADAVTRMILHVAAIHFLHVSSLFGVQNIVAAMVMIFVLTKVSINRSWKQAVQLAVTSKTFALVVWAALITTLMRSYL
jgi:hypothetical protein